MIATIKIAIAFAVLTTFPISYKLNFQMLLFYYQHFTEEGIEAKEIK